MSQNFGTPIDLRGNVIKNAGLDVVSALPTTFLVEGREVIFQGEVFRYLNGEWRINSFSAYSLKTYAELRELKDSNALVTGSLYVLTDFYTTFLAEDGETWLGSPDCEVIDHLGNPIVSDNYHILLQATSENTFSPQAYIFNQPDSEKPYLKRMSEWIIYFDFDLDLFGRIIYMNDVKYNNTYDFDIFNIRWAWKGYQIDMFLRADDLKLLSQPFDANSTYYLWSIGDIGGCFQSYYDIYNIAPELVLNYQTGVRNCFFSQSKNIFLYVQGKTSPLITSFNYCMSMCVKNEIISSTNILLGKECFTVSILNCSDIYLTSPSRLFMTNATNILSLNKFTRCVNLGTRESFDDMCSYLTFILPSSAYVQHSILLAKYSVFLANKFPVAITQTLDRGYPYVMRTAVLNKSLKSTEFGDANFRFLVASSTDILVTNPNADDLFTFKTQGLYNIQTEIQTDLQIIGKDHEEEVINSGIGTKTYLNYINANNESVRTEMPNTIAIETTYVVFFEDYLKKMSNSYFMPFVSFISNPTAWGYEIEETKYPTHEIFPVLASVFCNSGSITTQFAGKNLKFYVTSGGTTFYSSEYTINSNGTITVVK